MLLFLNKPSGILYYYSIIVCHTLLRLRGAGFLID